ncbi:hypothetical protein [Candidatus Nitrosocosmicus sp. SS]|uniref:hypothetical protein n=1 Tax=Candidatus Nitrosocosmicus agrestis TaxID=2563600 RepID=UPI00122DE430|nr:hypothetical protein [Candidatus Nitrosocosmicus sp. SS]KAA2282967.1 hypothetical protein F1Z66_04710 [Candidatus Nitrosocosmicus sp. SS]KAF0869170.1 hypothetical protein E5N71_06990 [Candidatus Nitrosocosmicus sp. SS]
MEKEISNNNNNNPSKNNPFTDPIAFKINKNTFGFAVNDTLRNILIHSLTITTYHIIIETGEGKIEIELSDCENAFDFIKQVEIGLINNDQFIRPEVVHTITEYLNKYPKSIEKVLSYFKRKGINPENDNDESKAVDEVLNIEIQNRNQCENNQSKGFSIFKQQNEQKIASLCNHILTYGTRINKKGNRVINTKLIYPNRLPGSGKIDEDNFKAFVNHSLFKACPSLLEMLLAFPVYERSEIIRMALENAVAHNINYKVEVDLEGIPFFLIDDAVKKTYQYDIEKDDLICSALNYIHRFGIKTDKKGNRILDSNHIVTDNSQILINPSFFEKDVSLLSALEKLPKETREIFFQLVLDALFCDGVKPKKDPVFTKNDSDNNDGKSSSQDKDGSDSD